MVGVISPCSIEYLKNRRPASPSATAPTTAAPRIPIQRSQSIGGRGGAVAVNSGGLNEGAPGDVGRAAGAGGRDVAPGAPAPDGGAERGSAIDPDAAAGEGRGTIGGGMEGGAGASAAGAGRAPGWITPDAAL